MSKYIILKKNFVAVLFDNAVQHSDVAESFGGASSVMSAGFFDLLIENGGIKVHCWGESTSLGGIKSAPDVDPKIIRHALGI